MRYVRLPYPRGHVVRKWVDERPLHESVALGQAILRAAIERVHSEEVESAQGEADAAKRSDASTSPQSGEMPS